MAESGGAERIANTLINRFGKKRVHWAMMFVAFLVGIPVFSKLICTINSVSIYNCVRNWGITYYNWYSASSRTVSRTRTCSTASSGNGGSWYFKADVGKTILYALIVGLPTAIISGPLYGKWIGARIHKEVPLDIAEQFVEKIIKRAS